MDVSKLKNGRVHFRNSGVNVLVIIFTCLHSLLTCGESAVMDISSTFFTNSCISGKCNLRDKIACKITVVTVKAQTASSGR